ncbi:MAG: gliding motility protein RemB, partial [Flavobacterium sp.]
MKKYLSLILLLTAGFANAQNDAGAERFPVYPGCEGMQQKETESCFYNKVQDFVFNNFKVPESAADYKGSVIVLFEVTQEGKFEVLYVDAANPDLAAESKRVFSQLPKNSPATYNGNPTYAKYTIKINIPLTKPGEVTQPAAPKEPAYSKIKFEKELTEFDSIKYTKFRNPQLTSSLNIPFSHDYYSQFDPALNQVGSNNHTASKPYTYAEVSKYYNIEEANAKLKKGGDSWLARKIWNENTVEIQGDGYWFTLNPIFDLQVGKNTPSDIDYTYVNTRGLQFQGGLGEQVTFTTTIFESQGRFADYYNAYAESIAPSGGNPAIIPGIGVAKPFKTNAYDFPMAEANLSFTPNKFFNMQLGYGRNFIGDGYRSLLEGDGASPYPFFKLNTTFWKIKYTNTYMWLKDVREEATVDRTYATKYMANHYLSWNMSKRFNMGFFESVVWANTNNRGFDMTFVNPIIFYRAVEIGSSSRSGNALLGATGKYKVNNSINLYGQFLLDEFSLDAVKAGDNSWKNKYGYQLGGKYFNAFDIKGLLLQVEFNHVRPYVYAHSDPLTNYGHNNQSMGHQWGGNFQELVAIARYHNGRYFGDAKITYGERGFDFDTAENAFNYGGNIYKDYEEN